jgi:TonB-linked SusC/RagA family outer membrane protein
MENKPLAHYSLWKKKDRPISGSLKFLTIFFLLGILIQNSPANAQLKTAEHQPVVKSQADNAKKKRISGKVTDEKGETIVGATVLVSGTNVGALTNIDGTFSLEVPENARKIKISYIGYNPKEVELSTQTTYKVVLQESNVALSEVMVVGYGYQKKESVVGAISQVGSEALVKSGNSDITNAIAGKLSGVLTIQQTGQPGQNGSEIVIRGLSSWNGSQPLVLVDGVERDFSNMDPNEVNTISVLKDASATAVFGAKGANGVIIVTTKRGSLGKPKLSISASSGVEIPTNLPSNISSYTTMKMLNVGYMNTGADNFQRLIPDNALKEYQNPSTPLNSLRYPDNNWFDLLTNPYAPNQQANINLSGGTKFVKYFVSLGYMHEGDFFKGYNQGFDNTNYSSDRINYRSNLDFRITPSTDISFNLGGDIQITNSHTASPWKSLYGASPSMYPAYFPSWVLNEVPDPDYPNATGIRYADKVGEYFDNPYSLFYSGSFNRTLASKLFTDLMLNQNLDFITKGLSFKTKVSLSTSYQNQALTASNNFPQYRLDFTKIGVPGVNPWFRLGQGNEVFNQQPLAINIGGMTGDYYTNLYSEFAANYSRTFGKHTITALALINFQEKDLNTDFGYYNAGLVGRTTYDYAGKYLLEMNLGYTGSERFAPANRFGFFPSMAVGWVVSEEKFFEPITSVMNKLKLRYSDGYVGSDNAAERWLYLSSYSTSGNYIVEDKAANSIARWEMAHKRDLGIEMGFLNNKLRLSVDLYDENRNQMLLTPNSVTFYVGNSFKSLNKGEMKKHGFEFEAEYNDKIGKNFNYFIKGNLGFNENRIIFKDDLPYAEQYQKQAGKPLGGQLNGLELNGNQYFTSVDALHLNPSPVAVTASNVGDYQYVDYNGDGIINIADLHPIKGSLYPAFTYSLSSGFSYKGFDFNFMFQGNSGKYVNYNGAFQYEFLKGNIRVHESQLDYWTPNNPNATHSTLNFQLNNDPKYVWAGGSADEQGYNGMLMGRSWRNADYLRLKEVYIGYTLKSKLFKDAIGVDNINIYATGNNLFTFTSLLEGDPETKDFLMGFYPQMISAKLGIKVSF